VTRDWVAILGLATCLQLACIDLRLDAGDLRLAQGIWTDQFNVVLLHCFQTQLSGDVSTVCSFYPSTAAVCLRRQCEAFTFWSTIQQVSMPLSSTGLSPTCHLAPSVSDVITLFHPCVYLLLWCPPRFRSRSPACFSSFTLPLSALSSPPFHSITTSVRMTPNCFSHSTHPTSIHPLSTFRMPFSKSLPGWLPIS